MPLLVLMSLPVQYGDCALPIKPEQMLALYAVIALTVSYLVTGSTSLKHVWIVISQYKAVLMYSRGWVKKNHAT